MNTLFLCLDSAMGITAKSLSTSNQGQKGRQGALQVCTVKTDTIFMPDSFEQSVVF